MIAVSSDVLRECGYASDLEVVSVQSIERVVSNLEGAPSARLSLWQEQGCAAEMGYMLRSPELLRDPRKLLPTVKTLICFVVPYLQSGDFWSGKFLQYGDLADCKELPGYGRVARYAWGTDYHVVIKKRLKAFVNELVAKLSVQFAFRVFVDAVPLLERSLVAGVEGFFIGHNSMLIRKKRGSFFFLAEVLCDLDCEEFGIVEEGPSPPGTGCGKCARCVHSCPTRVIEKGGLIDSRRCISYLTIEKKDMFAEWERKSIGNWIFGCDECQDICPFNHAELFEKWGLRGRSVGGGDVARSLAAELPPFLDLNKVISIESEEEFQRVFAGTAVLRTGRLRLLRNALAIIANKRYFNTISAVGDDKANQCLYRRQQLARIAQ